MPLTLLLRLPAPGDETEWLLVDEAGTSAGPRQRGPLTLAAAVGRTARVIVLAPATQILLAEPELPPGGGAKLARAVPYALEEQLTEDLDQLCFAVGRRTAAGTTPVAVVSRQVLEGWLATLAAAAIEPAAVYADIALLPANPGQNVLWLEGDRLAVRRPGRLPFTVELTPLADALQVAGVVADAIPDALDPDRPGGSVLHCTREEWSRVQAEVEALGDRFESLKIQLFADGPLPWLAKGLPGTDAVNLLQGEFAREPDYGARWRQWRVAALLGAILLGAHVAAQGLQIHQANRRAEALEAEIAQAYSAVMPGVPVPEAHRQMESRLARIRRSGTGPEYFLQALQAVTGAVGAVPKTSVDALSYRGQTLDMKVTAPSVDALSQLSQHMGRSGLTADIQSSTPVSGGVEAHLQLHPPAARTPASHPAP
jgi:general secretion pathway protein L